MENDLIGWIFNKLIRKGYWGHRPINEDDLPKGAIKEKYKQIIDIANKLANEGFLFKKKGRFGWRYSLNPKRKTEIIEFVKKHFSD